MIAITFGMRDYAPMAAHAARLFTRMTGLETRIITDRDLAATAVSHPYYMKYRLFDLVDDNDILYFDSDLVCLRPWLPQSFLNRPGIVAVCDRPLRGILNDCRQWSIPVEEYFNAGLLLINRQRHAAWPQRAQEITADNPPLRIFDQSALNAARVQLQIPLHPISRLHNWIGYGAGTLCYRMPVIMAHRLLPHGHNQSNLQFYENKYRPPEHDTLLLDESLTRAVAGTFFDRFTKRPWQRKAHWQGCVQLRKDGRIVLSAKGQAHHWFIHRAAGKPFLVFASATEILRSFEPAAAGSWQRIPSPETEILVPTPDYASHHPA